MDDRPLSGRLVLVTEDDRTTAMLIEELVKDNGGDVLGPFDTVAAAQAAVRGNKIDLAVLDVNLRDGKIYPVADMLGQRAIPFFILSGYGADSGPGDRPEWRWHAKPFHATELLNKMIALIQ